MQQPAAQLENNTNSIMQQPVAQLGDTNNAITQQPVAQLKTEGELTFEELFLKSILSRISWSHQMVLMDKEEHIGKRFWYMMNSLEHGNSRNVLAMQIESGLYERQVSNKKTSNFVQTLPPIQSDYANFLLKDPYIFDFVQAKEKADERIIEEQLAGHINQFLLELGQGFDYKELTLYPNPAHGIITVFTSNNFNQRVVILTKCRAELFVTSKWL